MSQFSFNITTTPILLKLVIIIIIKKIYIEVDGFSMYELSMYRSNVWITYVSCVAS